MGMLLIAVSCAICPAQRLLESFLVLISNEKISSYIFASIWARYHVIASSSPENEPSQKVR